MSTAPAATDLYRQILNLMPTPIFVVDDDLRIVEHNTAAHELLAIPVDEVEGQRGGHVLHCLNAVQRSEGCGRTPFCARCGLRNALNAAARGERRVHARAVLRTVEHDRERERVFHITVAPFATAGTARYLLVLDDRTEQAELESLFPLCSSCLQSRTDDELRRRAEDYLMRYWDADPTAGLCRDCRERLLGPDLVRTDAR